MIIIIIQFLIHIISSSININVIITGTNTSRSTAGAATVTITSRNITCVLLTRVLLNKRGDAV